MSIAKTLFDSFTFYWRTMLRIGAANFLGVHFCTEMVKKEDLVYISSKGKVQNMNEEARVHSETKVLRKLATIGFVDVHSLKEMPTQ